MAYLSRFPGGEQSLQRAAGSDHLLQLGHGGIVDLVEVNIVRAEVTQARFNVRRHGLGGAGHALGGEDEMLPDALQTVAQVFLADGVAPGGVDVIDAGVLQKVHQLPGALPVDALDGNAAEAHAGNGQAGFA